MFFAANPAKLNREADFVFIFFFRAILLYAERESRNSNDLYYSCNGKKSLVWFFFS